MAFAQFQLLQLRLEGLSGSGAKPRQGALKAHRLRNRQPSQGPAHASPTQPGTRRPEASRTGSPRVPLALIALATERKQRFTELKQVSQVTQLVSVGV